MAITKAREIMISRKMETFTLQRERGAGEREGRGSSESTIVSDMNDEHTVGERERINGFAFSQEGNGHPIWVCRGSNRST